MRETMKELAVLFREFDADAQAGTFERLADDSSPDLPRQVLGLFTQGMGGMFDPALTRDGVVDREANDRREVLAERLFADAKAELR
jgi:hypothetical protein